jgi:RpiR family carbohydrate utilization transcriptional regulator
MTILNHLKATLPSLSKAETRIAQAVLRDPESVINISTADLAGMAEVSDPMISRFCRSLGCNSFPQFKVQLAAALAAGKVSFISEAVAADDNAMRYIAKRINANQAALEYLRDTLDAGQVERAVVALAGSNRIEVFGMGGSAAIARDAQHKLFRLGIPITAYEDHLMQRMVAAAATSKTAVLCFSFTGRTRTTIEVAGIAKENNATLIAVTSPGSPLAQLADITLTSGDELEDTTIYVPMTTRIISLTIIDILATGLALLLGSDVDQRLQKIKHSLDSTKVD